MKKLMLLVLSVILASSLIFVSCGETTTTTTATTTTTVTSTITAPEPTEPAPTTTSPGDAKAGGSVIRIFNQGPAVLGYPPEMGPNDGYAAVYYLEGLFLQGEEGLEGVLAESWEVDQESLTITIHVRKGVTFQDGTDLDAEAVKWNFEIYKEAKRPYFTNINSIDITDSHTLVLNLDYYDITSLTFYSQLFVISPTAFENAGTDDEARKVWARMNPVSTAPYKVVEYKRDAHVKLVKNPNYWRENRPLIDEVTLKIVPDVMVSSALIQAGDADCWAGNNNMISSAIDLKEKGFGVKNGSLVMTPVLFFNSDDPNMVWANKAAREAVEYAINRPQIADLVGYGYYVPCTQVGQPGYPSYNEGYNPRPYNPEKAKELLEEAGLTNIKTKIFCIARDKDTAAAIQGYLKVVGIDAELDIGEPSRYYAIYSEGWSDLCLAMLPLMPDSSEMVWQMGSRPLNFKKSILKSPEFLALGDQALMGNSYEEIIPILQQMVRQVAEDCQYVPIYSIPYTFLYQHSYHTTYLDGVTAVWRVWDDWTDK